MGNAKDIMKITLYHNLSFDHIQAPELIFDYVPRVHTESCQTASQRHVVSYNICRPVPPHGSFLPLEFQSQISLLSFYPQLPTLLPLQQTPPHPIYVLSAIALVSAFSSRYFVCESGFNVNAKVLKTCLASSVST